MLTPPVMPVTRLSPVADKIALFRALFRGRDDVYARRFESRSTGKAGYSPACLRWTAEPCVGNGSQMRPPPAPAAGSGLSLDREGNTGDFRVPLARTIAGSWIGDLRFR